MFLYGQYLFVYGTKYTVLLKFILALTFSSPFVTSVFCIYGTPMEREEENTYLQDENERVIITWSFKIFTNVILQSSNFSFSCFG